MIRRNSEKIIELKKELFKGEGEVKVRNLINNPDEMNGKGRAFAHSTLQPGHSIGFHIHKDESETYYIYSGTAEFNDNGTLTTANAGDVLFTPPGEGHGLKNIGTEPLEFIALILYK